MQRSSVLGPEFVYYRSHSFIFAFGKKATGARKHGRLNGLVPSGNMVYLGADVPIQSSQNFFVLDGQTGELVHEEYFAETGGYYWESCCIGR